MKLERIRKKKGIINSLIRTTAYVRARTHVRAYKYKKILKIKSMKEKISEKILERNLREEIKKLGGWAVKFWGVSFSGFPDRIILMPGGKISFVELKTTGKKPSPKQEVVIEMLRDLGFQVSVIDTKILLDKFLKSLQK